MWSVEQWAALIGAVALIGGTLAALVKAIGDLIIAFRKRDDKPAPTVGITATPAPDDDIDYRAYADVLQRAKDAERDRDLWMRRALGIDEDTEPTGRSS